MHYDLYFSIKFNLKINLREVSSPRAYYENGKWITIPAMSIKGEYEFDEVGKKGYLHIA